MGILINKNELNKYFTLYLLEQKYFYRLTEEPKKRKKLFTTEEIKKSKQLSSCYSKQLDMMLKKII